MSGLPGGRRGVRSPLEGGALARITPSSAFGASIVLAAAFALLLFLYLLWGNALLLAALVVLAAAGTDRVLRMHPQGRFHGAGATLLYLFVPALFALGWALLLIQTDNRLVHLGVGLAVVLLFTVAVNAEYLTIDPNADTYESARLLLLIAIYVAAFAMFAVVFTANLNLVIGMALVGGTSLLLTIDVLRELETDTNALLWQAGAVALVMAECRLALYYLSLPDLLGGAFLFIVFYVATGLVQNQVSGRLDRQTWLSYGGVGLLACAAVVVVRLIDG